MKSFLLGILTLCLIALCVYLLLFRPSEGEQRETARHERQQTSITTLSEESKATEEVAAAPVVDIAREQHDELRINHIDIPTDVWAVVYTDDGGKPGVIASRTRIEAGAHSDVTLHVNDIQQNTTYYVVLHTDAGVPGVFEFPGTDVALAKDGLVFVYPVVLE